MLLKCNYCDPVITKEMKAQGIKGKKSINTDTDEYIKDEKNKYYHTDCYVQHLIIRKHMNETEAIEKMEFQLIKVKQDLKELQDKDKFYKWIMKYYDTSLPSYFCMKITDIINGTYEKVNEPIPYTVLLDIYEKMSIYLNKNAFRKTFKNIGQRMNYDLAVVLGHYGDYKNYIEKQKLEKEKVVMVKETLQDQKKISQVIKNKENNNDNQSFNLSDVINDMLL
jgi:hypothetical protein